MFDTVFLNGTIYDGSGGPPVQQDIGVRAGKIAAIGDLKLAEAAQSIDVAGLAATPGFIDLHTHPDFTLVVDGRAQSQVHQGVTTEVVGQCGISCAPLRAARSSLEMAAGFPADAVGQQALAHVRRVPGRARTGHLGCQRGGVRRPRDGASCGARRCDAFDVIRHDWNNTGVISILPKWVREGGTAKTLERLKDPAVRQQVKDNPAPMLLFAKARQWHEIVLLNAVANRALIGTDFAEIGRMRGVDPYDALMDMLIEEGEHDAPRLMWATHSFSEDQVELFTKENACAVISDTAALAPEGALKDQLFSLSGYGWAARFVQHDVRDRKVLPLAEAIRRITPLPASRLGLRDRGTLQVGNWADITVFDPAQIESRFSVRRPREYPGGIAHVMVNGDFAMQAGQRSECNSGRVLRAFQA